MWIKREVREGGRWSTGRLKAVPRDKRRRELGSSSTLELNLFDTVSLTREEGRWERVLAKQTPNSSSVRRGGK